MYRAAELRDEAETIGPYRGVLRAEPDARWRRAEGAGVGDRRANPGLVVVLIGRRHAGAGGRCAIGRMSISTRAPGFMRATAAARRARRRPAGAGAGWTRRPTPDVDACELSRRRHLAQTRADGVTGRSRRPMGYNRRFRVRVAFSLPVQVRAARLRAGPVCTRGHAVDVARRGGRRRRPRCTSLWTYRQLAALQGRDRVVLLGHAHRAARGRRSSPCCGRCCCSRSPSRSRTSSASCSTTRAACRWPTRTAGRAASSCVEPARHARTRRCCTALGKRFVVARLPLLVVGRAAAVDGRPHVPGHRHAPRRRARPRARRDERPAGRRPRRGQRRRRQRRDARSTSRSPGSRRRRMPVFTVGVGKERLTRDVQVTRVETPRRVAQGRVARRRRRRHADRATPARRSR